jgi:cytochrome b561
MPAATNPLQDPARYGRWLVTLHWLMLLLIVAVYACIELREFYPRGSGVREALKAWHFSLGIAVFVVVWVRLAVRLSGSTPNIVPAPPRWQRFAANTVELAMYLFMIAMPLMGWVALNADGKEVEAFGIALPDLIAIDAQLADSLEEIHETVGKAGYAVIGLHALAALWHHYARRDNTLRRMLPVIDR